MRLEQLMLILAGLACLGAFFLPFLHLEQQFLGLTLVDANISGYSYVLGWLDYFDIYKSEVGGKAIKTLINLWQKSSGINGYVQVAGLFFVLTGPVWYALYGLGYLFRGLTGKSFKRGIFFNLLFMGLSWGLFFWITKDHSTQILGENVGLNLNFFGMTGIGYWLCFAAVFVAGFSLLFEKSGK